MRLTIIGVLAVLLMSAASPELHIELVKSSPVADTVLSTPPTELALTFSAELDYERSAVTLRGPDGSVALSDPHKTDDRRLLKVIIDDALSDGRYTVSWTAAPVDDHGGRGRFRFEVQRER